MKLNKICQNCGRGFDFRRKWKSSWSEIRFCSDQCRKSFKQSRIDFWKSEILKSCHTKTSICPSEIAIKALPDNWRNHLEFVRQAARLLVADGKLVILQNNNIACPSNFKGPIRLKLTSDV